MFGVLEAAAGIVPGIVPESSATDHKPSATYESTGPMSLVERAAKARKAVIKDMRVQATIEMKVHLHC